MGMSQMPESPRSPLPPTPPPSPPPPPPPPSETTANETSTQQQLMVLKSNPGPSTPPPPAAAEANGSINEAEVKEKLESPSPPPPPSETTASDKVKTTQQQQQASRKCAKPFFPLRRIPRPRYYDLSLDYGGRGLTFPLMGVIEFNALIGVDCYFLIKELTIKTPSSIGHWLFRTPSDFAVDSKSRMSNRWLRNKYHSLDIEDGNVSYNDLIPILKMFTKDCLMLFTKGLEKSEYLSFLLQREVHNLDILKCAKYEPSFNKNHKCFFHQSKDPKFNCSMEKCLHYYQWCLSY